MSSTTTGSLSIRELCVILMAGLGGLLYGVDIGVIAAALPYISDTVRMTLAQTSFVVAAVLAGSSISSVAGGILADRVGRKGAVITSAVMFVGSIVAIGTSHAYMPLLVGRFVQGMSGGIVAVAIPLYLAEELSAEWRGRGSAIFQFSLTFGIAVAAVVGSYYTRHVEELKRRLAGVANSTWTAEDHAWRSMFFALLYPGVAFLLTTIFIKESRYWIASRARLRHLEMIPHDVRERDVASDSMWQRKYVVPFLLACAVLACNQATGINSILSYTVLLLHQAGLSATHATQGDLVVKIVNCMFTLVAFSLVDRKGRKFLLVLGTSGIVLSLVSAAILFRTIEGRAVDAKIVVRELAQNGSDTIQVESVRQRLHLGGGSAYTLSILYDYGRGEKIVSATSADSYPVVTMVRGPDDLSTGPPAVLRAHISPTPAPIFGAAIMICIALFIAFFAVGPGVVVWLTLSELMPTRIRSKGMGFALLLNQGVSTASAAIFLPVVGHYGNSVMLGLWAACALVYALIAVFLLPETKGKRLEEIERLFS